MRKLKRMILILILLVVLHGLRRTWMDSDSIRTGNVDDSDRSAKYPAGFNKRPMPDVFYDKIHTNHNYDYLHNPTDLCKSGRKSRKYQGVKYLFAVASAPWEHSRRKIIRRTWASERQINSGDIGVAFFVGNNGNADTNSRLTLESERYGDIVQENYFDTYRNLSIKSQGQLKWMSKFCRNADFLIHVDDDVFPDVKGIIVDLASTNWKERAKFDVGCSKIFKPTVRRDGKWKTSFDEYPGDEYPLSCVGWCFALSFDLTEELYHTSLHTKMLHLEDVWITGILREKFGGANVRKFGGGGTRCKHLGWPKDNVSVDQKLRDAWESYKQTHGIT